MRLKLMRFRAGDLLLLGVGLGLLLLLLLNEE